MRKGWGRGVVRVGGLLQGSGGFLCPLDETDECQSNGAEALLLIYYTFITHTYNSSITSVLQNDTSAKAELCLLTKKKEISVRP